MLNSLQALEGRSGHTRRRSEMTNGHPGSRAPAEA